MDVVTAAEILGYVLGPTAAAAATADQQDRADKIAAALNSEVTTFLEWPTTRVATAGELAELALIGQLMGSNLWARRDAPNGVVAAFTGDAGQVVRVARDAVDTVRPWLERIREGAGGSFG